MQFFQAESLHPRSSPALFYKAPLSLASLDPGLKQAVAETATDVQKRLCVLNSNLIRSPGA